MLSQVHWNSLRDRWQRHKDFLLILCLFVAFRLSGIFFFRVGGYIRDYTDLIYYQSRASWQDFGLLPYRDYWSEYPPLFTWFTLWVDKLSQNIPLWEDERLWFAVIFGLCTVAAESVSLVSLYMLGHRLHPNGALRVTAIYASLFLPVYLLGGWYDALAVATILGALTLLLYIRKWIGVLLFAVVVAIGGLLKLVPLALLAILPLALSSWRKRITAAFTALAIFCAAYYSAYLYGPDMTMTSLRSLVERSGWSTLYALSNHYLKLGTVQGDVFSTTPTIALYQPQVPGWLFLGVWLIIGLVIFMLAWRQQPTPQSDRRIVTFAALTYTILLLAYPAWNPQYALYILPFLPLLWPNARGVFYALILSALVLLEHPLYFNMIGPDYPPVYRALIDVDYEQLLVAIIWLRTALLTAIGLDIALTLLWPATRIRLVPIMVTLSVLAMMLALIPRFTHAYTAGRLASSPLRALAIYLNTQEESWPVITQQQAIGRELRPFLNTKDRLIFAGGRPARIDPLPALVDAPFIYLNAPGDEATILDHLNTGHECHPRISIDSMQLWYCNGARLLPISQFADGIQLLGAFASNKTNNQVNLTLFWETEQPIATSYTAFVHIADMNEKIVGQWDQTPGGGLLTTEQWVTKTIIVDNYRIVLDPSATNGPYHVWLGLYNSQTGERLTIGESDNPVSENRLELTTLQSR